MNDGKREFESPSEFRQTVKKLLIGLANFYSEPLNAERLSMFCEVLSDVVRDEAGVLRLESAIRSVVNDSKIVRFPLPAVLRDRILTGGNLDIEAIDAAGRIAGAISRFGYTNEKDARTFIGELGWRVVEREGGWSALCENTTTDQIPVLKAQWRETAKAISFRVITGRGETPPSLYGENVYRLGDVMGKVVNSLGSGKPEKN